MSNLSQFIGGGLTVYQGRPFLGYGSGGAIDAAASIAATSVAGSQGCGGSLNTVVYVPFYIHEPVTLTNLSIITTNSGSNDKVRLGVYSSSNNAPSTLIVAAPEIVITDSLAASTTRTAIISQLLDTGLYWAAIVASVSLVGTRLSIIPANPEGLSLFSQSHAYAALPASASATAVSSISINNIYFGV